MTINVAKLSKLPQVNLGYVIDPTLPVIPLSMDISNAAAHSPHKHPRAQLLYASDGVMRVIAEKDVFVVPSSQAVWLPPETEHMVYFPGDVSLRNLFVDPSAINGLAKTTIVFRVSPLLRELILKAMNVGVDYSPEESGWRLMQVILDELILIEPTPLYLPMAKDERAKCVMEALIRNPGDKRHLQDWAEAAFTSPRTLERLFTKETGMSFGSWRQKLRLLEAVDRIGNGQPVTKVAYDLGYESLSAFIEMFHKALGAPPTKYFRECP